MLPFLSSVMMLLSGLCCLCTPLVLGAADTITLLNYQDGETIRHTVPLLRGTLADTTVTSVEIINESSQRASARMTCLAHEGGFKALTELVPGVNRLVIRAGSERLSFTLTYQPQTNPHVIRCIYAVDASGNTAYQTPYPHDAQRYADKLSTMMLMMQTFTAERMHDLGLGRNTFNLELDEQGKVRVHVMTCDLPAAEIYTKGADRNWLFDYMANQAIKHFPAQESLVRNAIYIGFSRYDAASKQNLAYTALGGGLTAVFGGSNMYCYPETLADIQSTFMNPAAIDTEHYSNDSAGRDTIWACASTSIGATLHEIGHSMDLPHCADGQGIMSRGFDYFSRFWVLREAPANGHTVIKDFTEAREAQWEPSSAFFLRHTTWLALDARPYSRDNRIRVTAGTAADEIMVSSPDGIRAIILGKPGLMTNAIPIDISRPAPTTVTIRISDYPQDLQPRSAMLRIVDTHAHVSTVKLHDVLSRGVGDGK